MAITNSEIQWLLARIRREDIDLSRITGGAGADPGDIPVWDGDEWVPTAPPEEPGGTTRGVDLPLNFVTDTNDNVAVAVHGLGSQSLTVQLITTVYEGLWAMFQAPWRILDDNRIEVRASREFLGPARAIVTAVNP